MKYENPTCEIVLLDNACLETSVINFLETPLANY